MFKEFAKGFLFGIGDAITEKEKELLPMSVFILTYELALRFIVSNPAVTVVIPGMADAAEIAQNVKSTSDTSPLTDSEIEKIAKIKDSLGTNFCRRCNYCAPCTAGINISGVFLFEGYYSRYDLKEWALSRYSSLPKTASDCIECGACEERCPYNLPIRQMLKKAAEVMGK